MPASVEANALPIAKPSGRLWANSTPKTSSDRVAGGAAPGRVGAVTQRPPCEHERERSDDRGGGDGARLPLLKGRFEQSGGRGDGHDTRGEPAEHALRRARPRRAEREHGQRAEPGRHHGRGGDRGQQQRVVHRRNLRAHDFASDAFRSTCFVAGP